MGQKHDNINKKIVVLTARILVLYITKAYVQYIIGSDIHEFTRGIYSCRQKPTIIKLIKLRQAQFIVKTNSL
jgi:hypothetical protein